MKGGDLSTYQACILGTLSGDSENWSGAELRKELKGEFGFNKSGPAFYAAMARLEKNGLVGSKQATEEVRGSILDVKVFFLKAEGAAAFKNWISLTKKFSLRSPWVENYG